MRKLPEADDDDDDNDYRRKLNHLVAAEYPTASMLSHTLYTHKQRDTDSLLTTDLNYINNRLHTTKLPTTRLGSFATVLCLLVLGRRFTFFFSSWLLVAFILSIIARILLRYVPRRASWLYGARSACNKGA
jgi:hypothetical protein